MKRGLAVLLVMMLVPCFASSSEVFHASFSADSDLLGEYLSLCGINEKTSALISEIAGVFLEHAAVTGILCEQGGHLELLYDETGLMDIDWALEQEGWMLHTSVAPGIQLIIPGLEPDEAFSYNESQVLEQITEFYGELEPIHETGRFWGYAYHHGDERLSVTLSQEQMTDLLSRIISALGLSQSQSVLSFLETEQNAALENRYSLLLSTVYDQQILCGVSLTLMDHGTQVAAFSAGLEDTEFHAVFGIGCTDAIYYCELKASYDADEKTVNISGEVFSDPFGMGFEAVRGYNLSLGSAVLNLHMNQAEQQYDIELQLEKEGHALLIERGQFSMLSDSARFHGSALLPEYMQAFYDVDMSLEKSDDPIEFYHSEEDQKIRLWEAGDYMDSLIEACDSGISNLFLKLFSVIPEMMKLNPSD